MQFDKRMLDRILKMSDSELNELIAKIAAEAGIDPSSIGLDGAGLASLRQALGSASTEDVQRLGQIYGKFRQNQRGH